MYKKTSFHYAVSFEFIFVVLKICYQQFTIREQTIEIIRKSTNLIMFNKLSSTGPLLPPSLYVKSGPGPAHLNRVYSICSPGFVCYIEIAVPRKI